MSNTTIGTEKQNASVAPEDAGDIRFSPSKPVYAADIARLREGMEIWRAAQVQAGAPEDATVIVVATGRSSRKVSLSDLDGIVTAFLSALPDKSAWTPDEEWWATAGARIALLREEGSLATLGTALIATCHGVDEVGLHGPDSRLLTRVVIEDGTVSPWFCPLNSTAKYADRCSKELIASAGIAAALRGAGGVRWTLTWNSRRTVMGMVALPHVVWTRTVERDHLDGMLNQSMDWMGLAHWTTCDTKLDDNPREAVAKLLDRNGRFLAAARRLRTFGGDWRAMDTLVPVDEKPRTLRFAVPGFVPCGEVTLVAGGAGGGKSTMLTDLAVRIATPVEQRDEADTFWGVPAKDMAHGVSVFLSGEDGAPIFQARLEQLLDGRPKPEGLIESHWTGQPLDVLIPALEKIADLRLVVVDPALVFLGGLDEKDSGAVDAFTTAWRRLAVKKDCAVVIVHHLKKGAKPGHPKHVVDREYIRGAQAWVDRPRAVIGCVPRRGGVVLVGVAKHNIPALYPMRGFDDAVVLQRDDKTLRLLPHDGSARPAVGPNNEATAGEPTKADAAMEAVVSAVVRACADGVVVMRTGKRGVFELGLQGLESMGRPTVRGAMDAAIAAGRLLKSANGRVLPAGFVLQRPEIHGDTAATAMAAIGTRIPDFSLASP